MSKRQKTSHQNQYDGLNSHTVVVTDTGDVDAIKRYMPQDATTNPSLLFKACQMPQYQNLVDDAIAYAKANSENGWSQDQVVALAMDKMSVNFGIQILKIVPGYVSTEVDARLSYDVEGNLYRARRIIGMYEQAGISRDRVLIKLASTWEGFETAKILKKEGISCNMTLLFVFCQAVAAANAGVRLISPFVGRILDWYKKSTGRTEYAPDEDPGVLSVRKIYNYYKKHGFDTIVMGASFRNKGELLALSGCDRLTIAPKLLDELKACNDPVPEQLSSETAKTECTLPKLEMSEKDFRIQLNDDACGTEKLAEGIRGFAKDIAKLEATMKAKIFG